MMKVEAGKLASQEGLAKKGRVLDNMNRVDAVWELPGCGEYSELLPRTSRGMISRHQALQRCSMAGY